MLSEKDLLEHVKLAINPKFTNWVLFSHGTYIIFDKPVDDINAEALKLMEACGPVYVGSEAGDFSVIHLNKTEGWAISGHCYGMYTYVHPSELDKSKPNDVKIGVYGRSKRGKDGKDLNLIYTNR